MLPRPQPDHIDSTRVVEQQRVTSGTNKSETSSTCNCRILFSFLRQSEQSGQSNNMAQATAEGQSPQSMCFAIPANPGVCPIFQERSSSGLCQARVYTRQNLFPKTGFTRKSRDSNGLLQTVSQPPISAKEGLFQNQMCGTRSSVIVTTSSCESCCMHATLVNRIRAQRTLVANHYSLASSPIIAVLSNGMSFQLVYNMS